MIAVVDVVALIAVVDVVAVVAAVAVVAVPAAPAPAAVAAAVSRPWPLRRSRSRRSSWAILPVQSSTRWASSTSRSGTTLRKWSRLKSSIGDEESRWRSMLLGVNTTSGLRQTDSAWRRSRWKYWAAVDGWQ